MCEEFDRNHQEAEKMKRRGELEGAEALRTAQALASFFERV